MKGGTTIPLTLNPAPTQAPDPIPTDIPEPPPDGAATIYETYYWTIRYFYFSYYWTIYIGTSTVTSTEVMETTIISVTETDMAAATSSLSAISESVLENLTTPLEATTAMEGLTRMPEETATSTESVPGRLPTPSRPSRGPPPVTSGPVHVEAPGSLGFLLALGAAVVGVGMVLL